MNKLMKIIFFVSIFFARLKYNSFFQRKKNYSICITLLPHENIAQNKRFRCLILCTFNSRFTDIITGIFFSQISEFARNYLNSVNNFSF